MGVVVGGNTEEVAGFLGNVGNAARAACPSPIAHRQQGTAAAEENSSDLAPAALFSRAINQEGEPKGFIAAKEDWEGRDAAAAAPYRPISLLSSALTPCSGNWFHITSNT